MKKVFLFVALLWTALLAQGQIRVTTFEELDQAILNATGTVDNPTVVLVAADIEIEKGSVNDNGINLLPRWINEDTDEEDLVPVYVVLKGSTDFSG